MSRTHHKNVHGTMVSGDTRKASRPMLTKGPRAAAYTVSTFDYSEGKGSRGWATWLRDFCGYAKQRKRRRQRKIMKIYGRRVARRKNNHQGQEY